MPGYELENLSLNQACDVFNSLSINQSEPILWASFTYQAPLSVICIFSMISFLDPATSEILT